MTLAADLRVVTLLGLLSVTLGRLAVVETGMRTGGDLEAQAAVLADLAGNQRTMDRLPAVVCVRLVASAG